MVFLHDSIIPTQATYDPPMRIIAGEFRRRVLLGPKDASTTRPIPDRVKESIFNILRGHFDDGQAVFVDAFAGTGAFGLEAISRGAARCHFIEQNRDVVKVLRTNIETLDCEDRCDVFQGDALGAGALASSPRPITVAFLDPPYLLVQEPIGYRRVMAQLQQYVDLLTDDGFAILRTPWPLQHEVVPQVLDQSGSPIPQREVSAKDKRGMVKKGRSWRRRPQSMDMRRAEEQLTGVVGPRASSDLAKGQEDPDVDAAEGVDSGNEDAHTMAAPAPKVEYIMPSLLLPNATGPETHTYGTMAVHMYMKKRAQ